MSNGPTNAATNPGQAAARSPARYAVTAGIIALGAIVAAGTLRQTTSFLPQTTLVHRLILEDSVVAARPITLAKAASTVARGGLDAGVEHARIDYWTKRLSTTMSSTFELALGRMKQYSGMIEQKLAAKGMPHDLIYLAMIESEFNPSAQSPMHAVGMWQFMSPTARRFGLTVHGRVDERRDPSRATDAAVAYLGSLYDRFGSWYLAAAAYNSGEGTVSRALKQATGRTEGTDEDFFKILPSLPKETQDYVPKLIASARIGSDPAKYGIEPRSAADVMRADVMRADERVAAARENARSRHQPSRSEHHPRARVAHAARGNAH